MTEAGEALHGELRDELVHAMQRVHGARGSRSDARPAVGRHHQSQLPGGRRRSGRPHGAVRHPPRRQRHPPPRDQPRGGARGDGRRRRGRGRCRGARVPAPRGLPRHAVHRGHADGGPRRPSARRRSRGSPTPSAASTRARRSPACSSRSAMCEAYRALAEARGVPDAAGVRARAGDRPPDRARADREPARAAAVPQRLPAGQPDRRRGADAHRRLGVRGDGRPVLRPRQLQHQQRPHAGRGSGVPRRLRRDAGAARRPPRPAGPVPGRVGLPRGDVGRASAGDQHARLRLPRLRRASTSSGC